MYIDDHKCSKSSSNVDLPSLRSKHGDLNYVFVPTDVFVFACFVLGSLWALVQIGVYKFTMLNSERFVMLQVEILGLSLLRATIKNRKSVGGISGSTFLIYSFVYLARTAFALYNNPPWDPNFEFANLGLDPVLGFCSFLLVLDILKSIFVTHLETYDAHLDVLKAWYLLPACFAMGVLVHVSYLEWTFAYRCSWNAVMYMDILALMPQVAMMAMSGGKVATPIANFVAATAVSRLGDIVYTIISTHEDFMNFKAAHPEIPDLTFELHMLDWDTWLVLVMQCIHLLLVADFMYYYLKARTSADNKSDNITLLV